MRRERICGKVCGCAFPDVVALLLCEQNLTIQADPSLGGCERSAKRMRESYDKQ